MTRVVTLGEALGLMRTPVGESFERGATATIDIAGAEANVAIGLARLGVRAAWLGRVGDDPLGRRIARELRAEGVETHAVIDPGAPTAVMLKETPRPERTRVVFHRRGSAGSRLCAQDLDLLDLPGATWVHVTGIPAALSETAADAVRQAMIWARAAGIPVSFDINHRESLWPISAARRVYLDLLALTDVAFAGADEFSAVLDSQGTPRELAEAVSALGPGEVVVKHGARGAGAYDGTTWLWADAVPVAVIDTVGAGDAFNAGYLSIRTGGGAIEDALARGVRAGAAVCETAGDWDGALRLAELDTSVRDPVTR